MSNQGKQEDKQERCWFCRRAIYKAAEGSQGGGVVVDQDLQEAYLACQYPAVTNPFIQSKTANTNVPSFLKMLIWRILS